MIVLVLTACPAGLRGYLSRWLLEIAPGVFVGKVSARIRGEIWEATVELCRNGKAIMVFPAKNEQGFDFQVHRHDWMVEDFDGLKLISRPLPRAQRNSYPRRPVHGDRDSAVGGESGELSAERYAEVQHSSMPTPEPELRPGWSKASRYLKSRRRPAEDDL